MHLQQLHSKSCGVAQDAINLVASLTATSFVAHLAQHSLLRRLLAKLCVAREEIEAVGRESGWLQGPGRPVPGSTTGEVDNRPQNLALHFQQVSSTAPTLQ